jgi:hypothetical protein
MSMVLLISAIFKESCVSKIFKIQEREKKNHETQRTTKVSPFSPIPPVLFSPLLCTPEKTEA